MKLTKALTELREGETGRVCAMLPGTEELGLERLGLIVGTKILCLRRCPLGDPTAYALRGTVFALRRESTDRIMICPQQGSQEERCGDLCQK